MTEASAATVLSCEEVLKRALSLHESSKHAISAGGQRALALEDENYFSAVLLKNISVCVAAASSQADAALSKLLFDLAYSYSDSEDRAIPIQLARFYIKDPDKTRIILLDCEQAKRHKFIEILRAGLENLHYGEVEEIPRVEKLKQALKDLDTANPEGDIQ